MRDMKTGKILKKNLTVAIRADMKRKATRIHASQAPFSEIVCDRIGGRH
jgi:hypothetical protein